MKVLLLSALLVTSAAAPAFAQGSYPKAKPKKISRPTLEIDVLPSVRRSYAPPAAAEPQLPFCGNVQRPAHNGNWVVSTPGQTLGEGSVVQIERNGAVVGNGRIIQGGNGVAMITPESANVAAGDTLRLEYAVEPSPLPVSTANLPTSQDPSYQEWLNRPSSFGGSNIGFDAYGNYGGYGFDPGYGYGYGYGYDYGYNSCQQPCNNVPAPCPAPKPAPQPEYRAFYAPVRLR